MENKPKFIPNPKLCLMDQVWIKKGHPRIEVFIGPGIFVSIRKILPLV